MLVDVLVTGMVRLPYVIFDMDLEDKNLIIEEIQLDTNTTLQGKTRNWTITSLDMGNSALLYIDNDPLSSFTTLEEEIHQIEIRFLYIKKSITIQNIVYTKTGSTNGIVRIKEYYNKKI